MRSAGSIVLSLSWFIIIEAWLLRTKPSPVYLPLPRRPGFALFSPSRYPSTARQARQARQTSSSVFPVLTAAAPAAPAPRQPTPTIADREPSLKEKHTGGGREFMMTVTVMLLVSAH